MEIIKCWEEEGVLVPDPYKRYIKVMLAPDTRDVQELTFSFAIIYPESKTDYHKHDRPELILILSGRGVSICNGVETKIEPEMALWVREGEEHQIINTGKESLKLATVFVPGYERKELVEKILEAARKEK